MNHKKIIQERFENYGLNEDDIETIHSVFSNYVELTERKTGRTINDQQIKGILDTIDFSVRNILNFIKRDMALN